ncbi:hypothetical protein HanPSC8_Chr06g0234511 [Helianthus annuus]|nr:hypothetical protein HanPSC8_Chr06g0234511 [Helianthus annuus]
MTYLPLRNVSPTANHLFLLQITLFNILSSSFSLTISISNPKPTKMAPATFFFYLQQNMAPSLSLSPVSVSPSLCFSGMNEEDEDDSGEEIAPAIAPRVRIHHWETLGFRRLLRPRTRRRQK